MFLADFFIALVVAVILGLTLHFVVGWRHRRLGASSKSQLENLMFLISTLFGFCWAGGVWLPPMGPGFRESALLPFLITGAFITLLLITTGLGSQAYGGVPRRERATAEGAGPIFGAYFAILQAGLLIFVIVGYLV